MRRKQIPIRATAIKAGRQSMAHMHASMTGEARADTPAMRIGRLIHMAILEPVKLAKLPRWDGSDRRGAEWATFRDALKGDYVCADELPDLEAITESARPHLARIPRIDQTEVRVEWKDKMYGKATARVDAVLAGGGLLEVKSCGSIDRRDFLSQSYRLGYHLQLGWYAHGIAQKRGARPAVWVLAIESKPPHCCAVYEVPDAIADEGYAEAAKIATAYRCCEACGQWPGPYDDGVQLYEYPAWVTGGEKEIGSGETMEACEL